MTEQQTTEIRADVPVDYHPDVITHLAKEFAVEHPVAPKALAAAKEALGVAYQVHASINDAESQLRALASPDAPVYSHKGALLREHGAEEQLAKAAEQATQRALTTIERRVNELQSYESVLRATVNAALDHPERKTPLGIAESSEIRAHVKGLPEAERFQFVNAAISRNDARTVAAVLHSPAYLSGLDQNTHDTLRSFAAHTFAPTESALLKGVTKALDRMNKGALSLMTRTSEVTGIAAARAAKRQAALEKLAGVK